MRTWTFAAVVTLAATASALGAPEGGVDRERLRKVAALPSVGLRGWYYVVDDDGRAFEGGQEPWLADIATLRTRLKAGPADVERWTDLADGYRRADDAAQEKTCRANVVEVRRSEAKAHADDGRALASLGLALAAAGDDADADEQIAAATRAPRNAWAGASASADLLVTRAASKLAGRRFATCWEATRWLGTNGQPQLSLDAAVVDDAARRYDDAVAGVEKSSAAGRDAASVYLRRSNIRALLVARAEAAGGDSSAYAARARADREKAMRLLASDPFVRTINALSDAMTASPDAEGNLHVQPFERLPAAARARLAEDMAELEKLAASDDAETSARALQGIACVQWFVHRDSNASFESLRKSSDKCADVEGTWTAAVWVLAETKCWDHIVKLCDEWLKHGATTMKRMIRAKALSTGDHAADAETEWRAALALDPRGFKTNLGLAVFVLWRAADDAALKEAGELLRAASAALTDAVKGDAENVLCLDLANAVHLGLSGDVDGADKAARRMLAQYGDFKPTREVLAAIGR